MATYHVFVIGREHDGLAFVQVDRHERVLRALSVNLPVCYILNVSLI